MENMSRPHYVPVNGTLSLLIGTPYLLVFLVVVEKYSVFVSSILLQGHIIVFAS